MRADSLPALVGCFAPGFPPSPSDSYSSRSLGPAPARPLPTGSRVFWTRQVGFSSWEASENAPWKRANPSLSR